MEQLKKDKRLCEIYRLNNDPDRFSVGYILKVSEQAVLIQSISPYGEDDGYIYRLTEDIASIQTETEYLKNIEILINYNKVKIKDCEISEEQMLTGLFNYVKINQLICAVELCDDPDRCVSGFICCIDDNLLKLEIVELQGIKSGYAFMDINEISSVIVQSQDEHRLQVLYNHKNQK